MTRKATTRRATWLAFGLVVLATAVTPQDGPTTALTSVLSTTSVVATAAPIETIQSDLSPQEDHAEEANRAYKAALTTLGSISSRSSTSFISAQNSQSSKLSFLSHYLPGQGPVATSIRIVLRLHHHVQQSLTSIASAIGLSAAPKHQSGKPGRKSSSADSEEDLKSKSIKVLDLLQHATDLGHDGALHTLAKVYLFPPNPYFQFAPDTAISLLQEHAERTGNPDSHAFLGFFYASGYRPLLKESSAEPLLNTSQSKALLHYTFAAHGGHKGAQMALGYRFWSGIGVNDDCFKALEWYEAAATDAMGKFLSGPPGGLTLPKTPTRLSDLEGGVYGPGASAASTGNNNQRPAIKAGLARSAGETWEDVLEYYIFSADRGEMDFAYRLGKIFYQGSIYASAGGIASGSEGVGSVKRDYTRARHYFMKIARSVWSKDPANPGSWTPPPPSEDAENPRKSVAYASAAAGYIGRMYLRGEGFKRDWAMAKLWFERGAEHGDRECLNGLGIIWRDGLVGAGGKAATTLRGGVVDINKAANYFHAAARQDLAEAHVNMGKYHYNHGDVNSAKLYFEAALALGSPFEAYFYLGSMYATQATSTTLDMHDHMKLSSCSMAVSFYKLVAERGVWEDDILRQAEQSWVAASRNGDMGVGWVVEPGSSVQDKEVALLKWWIAAERGHEIAQNNLAWILDQDKSMLRLSRFSPINPSNETARLALTQWIRAAGQRNTDALVKVADYYYHGLGIPESANGDDGVSARLEKAAKYYQSAADTHLSALAMWSLGWMYENGVGVPKDFHLAKRHYDAALETNSEAYFPVLLSLGKLYIKSFWHSLTGGTGGLTIWSFDEEEVEYAHPAETGEGGQIDSTREDGAIDEQDRASDQTDEDDDYWYMGRAKDDFRRRLERSREDEDDPIQYARDHRRTESDRESDFGPEDDFEGSLRGGRRRSVDSDEDEDDEFEETMLLVLLCLAVSALLYIRARLMQRMRNEQQHQRPPQ